jgi:hypothetical protein
MVRACKMGCELLEAGNLLDSNCSQSEKGANVMEEVLRELVELTDAELDLVAGGAGFVASSAGTGTTTAAGGASVGGTVFNSLVAPFVAIVSGGTNAGSAAF